MSVPDNFLRVIHCNHRLTISTELSSGYCTSSCSFHTILKIARFFIFQTQQIPPFRVTLNTKFNEMIFLDSKAHQTPK